VSIESATSNQSNTSINTGAVVGRAAITLCILLSAYYYFRCFQSKLPADNGQHASNTAGHEDPQLTPVQQAQFERRPPELNPFFGLTVGDVYSEPAMAGALQAGGVLPEPIPQVEVLRVRREVKKEQGEVPQKSLPRCG
jgi:hypothetical protein